MKNRIEVFIFTATLLAMCFACRSGSEKELKQMCITMSVVRNGQVLEVDSCFTATSNDSLEKIRDAMRLQQTELREAYDTKLYFVIVDTLHKKPSEYEYAIVVSEAGHISPDVILTNDANLIAEKIARYNKKNIIFKKLITGESIEGAVEIIFKTNIRINYRREGRKRVKT